MIASAVLDHFINITVFVNNSMELSIKQQLCLTSAGVGLAGCLLYYYQTRYKKTLPEAVDYFDYLNIVIVKSVETCDKVVHELRRRCEQHSAIGFDCEWVTEKKSKRNPVAFIQLSSFDGYCGLFQLNAFESFPLSLKELLEDMKIYKVGVAPDDDRNKLRQDFAVVTKPTLDLRYIAECCNYEPGGLAALTNAILGAVLNKTRKIRCSNWEADNITEQQARYAAIDAHAAIKIFAVLLEKLRRKHTWFNLYGAWNPKEILHKYQDIKYKLNHSLNGKAKMKEKKKGSKEGVVPGKRYSNATRSKPLYHNCFLQAPDGELLCTCDNDKAMWYVEKELAEVVVESPLTVRLKFEPAGRAVGDVGRYYQLHKENRCVVCGTTNSYIRKNVVPREYRKFLPEIMKEHSSHDVVLLCGPCHQLSNIKDQGMRDTLARQCCAPMSPRYKENTVLKRFRSAANALRNNKHDIPEDRRKLLEATVLQHYPEHDRITLELLDDAFNVQFVYENADYECHGQKVVEYFFEHGGLLQLEEMWRQHFLDSVQPKYMPELWSTKHNEERLRVKWEEGRLSPEHLKSMGLTKI